MVLEEFGFGVGRRGAVMAGSWTDHVCEDSWEHLSERSDGAFELHGDGSAGASCGHRHVFFGVTFSTVFVGVIAEGRPVFASQDFRLCVQGAVRHLARLHGRRFGGVVQASGKIVRSRVIMYERY